MKTPVIRTLRASLSLVLGLLWSGAVAHAVVVSSLVSTPTDNVNIDHSGGTNNTITARYLSASNQRSVTQTFTWNSDSDMAGLGMLISSLQNTASGLYFTQSQSYFLDVQQLTSATGVRTVESTITTVPFTLTTSMVVAGQYLYFQFDTPLDLVNGAAYGYNFRAAEINAGNAVAFDTASVAYTGGVANQTASVAQIANGVAYGNAGFDYAFFTVTATNVPEPSTAAVLFGALAMGSALAVRRRK